MDGLPPPAGQPVEASAPTSKTAGRGILIVVSALVVLAIIGYTFGGGDDANIDPIVKNRVAELAAARDCRGLQVQFDIADRNGTTDILELVNAAMNDADCYD